MVLQLTITWDISWDITWGEDGYFKIQKGVNMCGIEGDVYVGIPTIN